MQLDNPEDARADDIEERIIGVLSRVLGSELVGVTPQTRLLEDLSIDSVSVLEAMLAIEDELDVQFDPEDVQPRNFATVGTLADLVRASL
jgi:acyl carrier protein